MTGRHRGRRGLRWRLIVAVLAAPLGRGYLGRHRLAEVALGVQQETSAPAVPAPAVVTVGGAAVPASVPMPVAAPVLQLSTPGPALPSAPMVVGGARLGVVSVRLSPDPLVDTVPHPVVKLFPMPVEAIHDAVFAADDAEREVETMIDLSQAGQDAHDYHGRHSA